MRILIAYGSKYGSTAGLAEWMAESLRWFGASVDVVDAASGPVLDASALDAVIVVGSVYSHKWNEATRSFVADNSAALSLVPVWIAQSGPLGESAPRVSGDVPVERQVARAAQLVGARGTQVFAGALTPQAQGFAAAAMRAAGMVGDWRDREHVKRWCADIYTSVARGA